MSISMRGVKYANLDNEKLFSAVLASAFLIIIVLFVVKWYYYQPATQSTQLPKPEGGINIIHDDLIFSNKTTTTSSSSHDTPPIAFARKTLALPAAGKEAAEEDGWVNREGEACSKTNIYVVQGPTDPLPNGIPTYTVVIENICISGSGGNCLISDIHFTCGWFSSARLINPNIFRRICYNDCLVNNGDPMSPGQTISFQYANTFHYPLYVSSLACN